MSQPASRPAPRRTAASAGGPTSTATGGPSFSSATPRPRRRPAAGPPAPPPPPPPGSAHRRNDVGAYLLIVGIALGALGRVTGRGAYAVCLAIGAFFAGAAGFAAFGGRAYVRSRTPLTVALRILFVVLHNVAVIVSQGPRRERGKEREREIDRERERERERDSPAAAAVPPSPPPPPAAGAVV